LSGTSTAALPVGLALVFQWNRLQQISVQQLHDLAAGIQIVDVRRAPEWQSGHVAGALHKPLDKLASTLASTLSDLDATRSLAVYCKIAASLLQRAGFEQVMNVTGGFDAWRTCDLPFVVEQHAATAAQ
jgi:hydroxyacylglutathione hydrolase